MLSRKFKIAFVLQGRFSVFYLALALMHRGHDVKVFINYPAWALRRFNMDPSRTKRFVLHGILARFFIWLNDCFAVPMPESFTHELFGRWAFNSLRKDRWDAIMGMSGVSEEFLVDPRLKDTLKIVVRASAHIRFQYDILSQEELRTHAQLDKPSSWMLAREEREYEYADFINVLSSFSYKTFVEKGLSPDKLWLNASAFPVDQFQATSSTFAIRRQRILSQSPLKILYVGNVSFQKGIWDLKQIFDHVPKDKFLFRLVGKGLKETKECLSELPGSVELCGKRTQAELVLLYQWADLFVFPTIQDGFPQVLAQAFVSGLPILTTTNCSSSEILSHEETGWILPIRRPDIFIETLMWCDRNRGLLGDMVTSIEKKVMSSSFRNWDVVAQETENLLEAKCH